MSQCEIRIWLDPVFIWRGAEGKAHESLLLGDLHTAWDTFSGKSSTPYRLNIIYSIATQLGIIQASGESRDSPKVAGLYKTIGRMLHNLVGDDFARELGSAEYRKRTVSQWLKQFKGLAAYLEGEANRVPPLRKNQRSFKTLTASFGLREVTPELLAIHSFWRLAEETGALPTKSALREHMQKEAPHFQVSDPTFGKLLKKCHLANLPKKGERREPDEVLTSELMSDPTVGKQRLLAIKKRLEGKAGYADCLFIWVESTSEWALQKPVRLPSVSEWRSFIPQG